MRTFFSLFSGLLRHCSIVGALALFCIFHGAFSAQAWQPNGLHPTSAHVRSVQLISTQPHDARAFTQGLVVHNGTFIESTGKYGLSTLRRVEMNTGRIIQSVSLDKRYFAEGIAVLNDEIWQLTWKRGEVLVYDMAFNRLRTYRIGPEGRVQGWGLTTDGRHLIMSNGSAFLSFRSPGNFKEIGKLRVLDGDRPVTNLNELEHVNGQIYANVWRSDKIAVIDAGTGFVQRWLDLSIVQQLFPCTGCGVANGIAWDAATKRLYITGKNWPVIHEILPD